MSQYFVNQPEFDEYYSEIRRRQLKKELDYLREEFKSTSEEQKTAKGARKTGTPSRKAEASYTVVKNRAFVTAVLNLMHDLRGTGIKHNVREEYQWYYSKAYSELTSKIEKLHEL